jgi:hypothetical protein
MKKTTPENRHNYSQGPPMPDEQQKEKAISRADLFISLFIGISVYLIFILPMTRIPAMDFSSLMGNLSLSNYETQVIDDTWMTGGVWALKFALLPLFLLLIFRFYFCLRQGCESAGNIIGEISRKSKVLIFIVVGIPLAVFSLAFADAFFVWLNIEVYWWIQWYGNLEPARRFMYDHLRTPTAAVTFITGLWLTHRALRKPPEWKSKWRKRAYYTLTTLLAAPLAAFVVIILAVSGLRYSRINAAVVDAPLFEKTCGQCHKFTRPLYFVKTPAEWRRLVGKMKKEQGVPLTDRTEERITRFLCGMRSFSDEWTFRTRCQRCHLGSYLSWEKRRPEDWEMIVDRVARYSPHYFQPTVKKQIVDHLRADFSDESATMGASNPSYDTILATIKSCTQCHYFSRNIEMQRSTRGDSDIELIRRMSEQMTIPITENQIEEVAAAYRYIISNDAHLAGHVPHDRPVLSEGQRK